MIAEIIKQIYKDDPNIHQLLEEQVICGNLFRSFDDFTQHLIFLMYANEGIISRSQFLDSMKYSPHREEGKGLLTKALANLSSIKVIELMGFDKIKLNASFATNLNKVVTMKPTDRGEPFQFKEKQFFNLLLLLKENIPILRECKIGNMGDQSTFSKENFDFIRLPIGYKISSLIKGYLKHKKGAQRKKTLRNILTLSQLYCDSRYKIPQGSSLIPQLQRLHLLKTIPQGYFVISPYLRNFAFEQKENNLLLQCSITVETNFKVYVQIPKTIKAHNYRLIKGIITRLIKIEYAEFSFQELIMGQINRPIMNQLFSEGITVYDYLSFFLQFMSSDLKIQKDLGKWNKITFLQLEGPQSEMMIPNNVKQELKLWETIRISSHPQFLEGEENYQNSLTPDPSDN